MAQGRSYTRQQLNQKAQANIRFQEAKAAREKAEAEALANDPRRIKLKQLQTARDTRFSEIDARIKDNEARIKAYQESGVYDKNKSRRLTKEWKALRSKRDDVRRDYFEEIRTVERAIAKNISISDQASNERDSRARRKARFAERDAVVGRFGEEVYNEMSPEARSYAYAQIQGRTTPTPNTAKAKDDYNKAQEAVTRANKRIDAINTDAQATYDEINANWAGATAGEYFEYKRTGKDPRASSVSRADYDMTTLGGRLGYSNAILNESRGMNRDLVTSENNPNFVKASKLEYQKQSFLAGFNANPEGASALGMGQTAGSGNFAYNLGASLYIPSRYAALYGVTTATSAATGAAYNLGTFGATGKLAATGGTIAALGPISAASIGTTKLVQLDARPRIKSTLRSTSAVSWGDFQAAQTAGYQNTGFLGELYTGFGSQEKFLEGFDAEITRRGYESGSGRTAALAKRRSDSGAELAGLVVAGAGANVVGALNMANYGMLSGVQMTGRQAFIRGFSAIGQAGVTEGFASSLSQNVARGESLSFRRAAYSGLAGGVSAGLLGGGISAAYARTLPKTRRSLTALGNILDPTEPGSDAFTAISRRPFGTLFPTTETPGFIPVVSANPIPFVNKPEAQRQVTLSEFGSFPPVPPPTRNRPFSAAYVSPSPKPLSDAFVQTSPNPNPNPNPRPSPRSNPNPFIPSNPIVNPIVPSNPVVPSNPNPNPNPRPQPNPLVDVPVTKFPLLPLGSGRGRLGSPFKFGRVSRPRTSQYTPSFAALELGIGSSNPRTKGSFTGFEIRPFLAPNTKKKKKGGKRRGKRKASRKPLLSLSLGGSPI